MQPMARPPDRDDVHYQEPIEQPRSTLGPVLALVAILVTMMVLLALVGSGDPSAGPGVPSEPTMSDPAPADTVPAERAPTIVP